MFTLTISEFEADYLAKLIESEVMNDALDMVPPAWPFKPNEARQREARARFRAGCAILNAIFTADVPARPDIGEEPAPVADDLDADLQVGPVVELFSPPALDRRASKPRCIHGVRFTERCIRCDEYTAAQDAINESAAGAAVPDNAV